MFDIREEERFRREVLGHLDAAYNLARWLVQDPHDAEDAVAEATLKALRQRRRLRGDDPKAWYLAIVRNTCMNLLRSRNRRHLRELSDLDPESAESSEPSALDLQEMEVDRERVQEALAALPVSWREIIVLREFEQMSYAEISAVIQVPAGTVMSRLSRARNRLRELLVEEQV